MKILLNEKERFHKKEASKKFLVILNYFFEDYYEYNPELATSMGIKYYDKLLKDYSDKGHEKERALFTNTKKKLSLVNPYQLTEDEHIDYLLLKSFIEKTLFEFENLPQARHTNPQLYIPLQAIYCLLMQKIPAKDKVRYIVARLKLIPKRIDQAKENLKNPPRLWTETTIEQMPSVIEFFKALTTVDIIQNVFKESEDIKNDFETSNKEAISALEEFYRYLQVDLIEKSHGEFCIGRQAFDFLLEKEHFIDYTSGYLNEMGYDLISKTETDMNTLATLINKSKTLEALLTEIETEHPSAETLLESYQKSFEKLKTSIM